MPLAYSMQFLLTPVKQIQIIQMLVLEIIITNVLFIQQMHLMFPHYQVLKTFSSEF